jgi:hypothetical protein
MNNQNFYDNENDLVGTVCLHHKKWGVYCSWPSYSHNMKINPRSWIDHIISCLPPGEFDDTELPYDSWFLKLFDNETNARDYYKQCRGEDQGIHDGVFAVLISSDGRCVTENT